MLPCRSHQIISDSLQKVAPFFTSFIRSLHSLRSFRLLIPVVQNSRSFSQIVRNNMGDRHGNISYTTLK